MESNTTHIKICLDPMCEAIFHNTPEKETHCQDCGSILVKINEDTYWKKFANNWFQYDFLTGEYYRPKPRFKQYNMFENH